MSKKVKKQMSVNDIVDLALVPNEKQPYEIPKNWVWIRSEYVANWGSGGTPSRKHPEYYGGEIPWIKTGDLKDSFIEEVDEKITEQGLKNSSAKLFPKGSVAIAMYGATIGKLGIFNFKAATNQACAVATPLENTTTNFLFYYFKQQRNNLINMGKGGAQPNISQTIIKDYPFPLPPLQEQFRIAEKVEHLLSNIEEAEKLIEESKKTFEIRRASILGQGLRGKLTEEWRKLNSSELSFEIKMIDEIGIEEEPFVLPNEWRWIRLRELCSVFSGKGFKKSEYTETGVRLLKIQNVSYRKINWEDTSYLPMDYTKKESKLLLKENDILIALNRPITNNKLKVGIINNADLPAILYQRVGCLRPIANHINIDYLYLVLTSSYFLGEVQKRLMGSDQPYINLPDLMDIPIPVMDKKEQTHLINIINNILIKETEALEHLNEIVNIDSLKQAILHKAFKGELGTNEPSEESAIELLKEILQPK
ncbi:restriction endonuclease subunit S [Neobacillus sp. K501]